MSDFGSSFASAMNATHGMFTRNRALALQQQEIDLRRPAAEAQQFENDLNRPFVEQMRMLMSNGPRVDSANPPIGEPPAAGTSPDGRRHILDTPTAAPASASALNLAPPPASTPTPGSRPLGSGGARSSAPSREAPLPLPPPPAPAPPAPAPEIPRRADPMQVLEPPEPNAPPPREMVTTTGAASGGGVAARNASPAATAPAPRRGGAASAISDGIAQRASLDPNAEDYPQQIMRVNDTVVSRTMPGGRSAASAAAPTAPAGQGSAQPPIRQLAAEGGQALQMVAQAAGVRPDQVQSSHWQQLQRLAEQNFAAPMARRFLADMESRRAAVLASNTAMGMAALEMGDMQGVARALNTLNPYLPDGNTNVFTPTATGLSLTRTPENGQGQPTTIPITPQQLRGYLMAGMNPQWWQEQLHRENVLREQSTHNRATEGNAAEGNRIQARGVALRERAFDREVSDDNRDQAGASAYARVLRNPNDPEAMAAFNETLPNMTLRGLTRVQGMQEQHARTLIAQQDSETRSTVAAARTELTQLQERRQLTRDETQQRRLDEQIAIARQRIQLQERALEIRAQRPANLSPEQRDLIRSQGESALREPIMVGAGTAARDIRPSVLDHLVSTIAVNPPIDIGGAARALADFISAAPNDRVARMQGLTYTASNGFQIVIPAMLAGPAMLATTTANAPQQAPGGAQGAAPGTANTPGMWNRWFGGGTPPASAPAAAPTAPTPAPPTGRGNPRHSGLPRPPATSTWNPVPTEGSALGRSHDQTLRERGIDPALVRGR